MTEKERYVISTYKITKDGKIFSYFTNKFLKFREDKDGYFDVPLVYNDKGGRMPFRVHRLVALKYIPNPNNLPVTNHKDLNKQNNCVENLEWTTVAKNTQHGYDNCAYNKVKRLKVIEPDGQIKIFPTISYASRYYGYVNPTGINGALNGKGKNPISRGERKGFYFELTDEEVTINI